MSGGVGGWSWTPDQDVRKRFMQFLSEARYCGDWDAFRLVARQFYELALIDYQKAAGSERQQKNEGPE